MNLLSVIPDNISEVLVKIIRFTQQRRRVLQQNIDNIHTSEYIPEDLPVSEFADVLNAAIAEHLQNRRLLFQDSAHISFGTDSTMRIRTVVDEHAKAMLGTKRDAYMELQIKKLLENSLNRRVAEELLKYHAGIEGALQQCDLDVVSAGNQTLDTTPPNDLAGN